MTQKQQAIRFNWIMIAALTALSIPSMFAGAWPVVVLCVIGAALCYFDPVRNP